MEVIISYWITAALDFYMYGGVLIAKIYRIETFLIPNPLELSEL